MRTNLQRISWRLSLIMMALCLYAALPGQGVAWGQTEGEVRFYSHPSSVSYSFIYEGDSEGATEYVHFSASNFTEGMAMRVQLADGVALDGVKFRSDGEQLELTLENGGFWVPDEMLNKHEEGDVNLNFIISSPRECTVEYTVSVYASKDLNAAFLASTTHSLRFLQDGQRPSLENLERISGELNTDIPFTIGVMNTGFLQGKPAKIKIRLPDNNEAFSLSGQNLTKDPNDSYCYILDIPSFSATKYTLTARTTEAYSGTYNVVLLDAEGNEVRWGSSASIMIPIEYSPEDIAALKAIAAANPLNNDLQNFISSGDYLKDRNHASLYNVGVKWNTETPSRVRMFFINDSRTNTVSSIDLSALTELEELDLEETKLESLDLSELTKLEHLQLRYNNSLTWSTVKLPSSSPEYFSIRGYTRIMAGTPVDDYNAYAASGTEVDLSAYATVGDVKSVYKWSRIERDSYKSTEVTMPAVDGKEGAFIFTGKPGEYYRCDITNANYSEWRMQTVMIKVARGSADYSQVDIDGLKKLAADNPNVTQLQEFVNSKGWENENWDSRQDVICTNWDTENRLTHLGIRFEWNSKDTISSLDLSAFTELKYFECERFMNIEKLDLSKNTKLETLYLYSKNLASLDLSKCPNLRDFRFGTNSIGEGAYLNTKLATLNLSGCSNLERLYLEHSPLATLDLSSFTKLDYLHVEFCPNLRLSGFEKATNLRMLELPNTEQFGDLVKNLPNSIRQLYLQQTKYELPSAEVGKNLEALGLPEYVENFDLAQYPGLRTLDVGYRGNSLLKYTGLKNYRSSVRYNGMSRFELISPSHPQDKYRFENGDTIDLSSQAVINGVETVFLWVNNKYGIEEKEALKPVAGRPGVFVLDSKEEGYGSYYCQLMNPQFCEITEINYRSGWQMETSYIHVETSVPQVFAESDVATLALIVGASNNDALSQWWKSGEWQTGKNSSNAQAVWNNENPRRLTELYLYQMGNSFAKEVDLLALDKLEVLSLAGNRVEKLSLPKNNTVLRSVMLSDNTTLKSLIVSGYPSLEHLDVANTGLTALDLSQSKNLTELNIYWTNIESIEKKYPEVAERLTTYSLPRVTTEIDLAKFPALTTLSTSGSELEFSGVRNPRQLDDAMGMEYYALGNAYPAHSAYGEAMDLSGRTAVAGSETKIVWVLNDETLDYTGDSYAITEDLNPNDTLYAIATNPLFPNWTIQYRTIVYTCPGDANLDKSVNVQDVTATVSYTLKENMIPNFGYAEADVNMDLDVNIADVIGIVNIIRDQPITKASDLRAEVNMPVEMELDTDNFLTMNSPVPVAGIYLELVGVTEELPLLGDAAKLLQASSLNGDTLRIVAYSLDGKTIPSGKSRILRMPAGVTLVGASFSDAKANSLRAGGDAIVTSNAPIEAIRPLEAVSNYPNPFRGSTTFRYQLEEPAQTVTIHVFSANGALAALLSGLPGEVGENLHTAALTLPAGVYYYRLTAKTGRGVKASNTNILIIK
ncbi:T9SS type A sorting domain-containing protein [Parabacteroides sp.]